MLLELRGGGMCPEQYDVFLNGQEVAYIRHRHGITEVDVPLWNRIAEFEDAVGDGWYEDDEREEMLDKACRIIAQELKLDVPLEGKWWWINNEQFDVFGRHRLAGR
jgi:hypothetical protein